MMDISVNAQIRDRLSEVLPEFVDAIIREVVEEDPGVEWKMPVLGAFVCCLEIQDIGKEQGEPMRFYMHLVMGPDISPAHGNGLLHEALNNWND